MKHLALQRGKHEDAQGVVAKEAQVHGSDDFKLRTFASVALSGNPSRPPAARAIPVGPDKKTVRF
ncbi:hypothetical protein LBMAG56_24470 [Verrucomicrobiota bacterium]|nr:hypothetical protein LBMAG56_24470 [Verrucomicrobiota bacterium]